MAVPDWPTTYGYNPFLYPWQTWVFGPWDQFIEHGHRLFGEAVGVVAIAAWFSLSGGVSGEAGFGGPRSAGWRLVIGQGVLGGIRVMFDKPTFARIHGCIGPLFFAYSLGLACVTSKALVERDEATG